MKSPTDFKCEGCGKVERNLVFIPKSHLCLPCGFIEWLRVNTQMPTGMWIEMYEHLKKEK